MKNAWGVPVTAGLYAAGTVAFFTYALGHQSSGDIWQIRAFEVAKWISDLAIALLLVNQLKNSLDRKSRERDTVLSVLDDARDAAKRVDQCVADYFSHATSDGHGTLAREFKALAQHVALLEGIPEVLHFLSKEDLRMIQRKLHSYKKAATDASPSEVESGQRNDYPNAISAYSQLQLALLRARISICK